MLTTRKNQLYLPGLYANIISWYPDHNTWWNHVEADHLLHKFGGGDIAVRLL